MLNQTCIEEWSFDFGFVIPHSTNSWQQVIRSAGRDSMMSPEIISGNVTINTYFYDENELIYQNKVRVFYI